MKELFEVCAWGMVVLLVCVPFAFTKKKHKGKKRIFKVIAIPLCIAEHIVFMALRSYEFTAYPFGIGIILSILCAFCFLSMLTMVLNVANRTNIKDLICNIFCVITIVIISFVPRILK